MVKTARETSGSSAFLPLNQPLPVRVEVNQGWPVVLLVKGSAPRKITSIEDVWRVEEEWWRDTPVTRTYFDVLLENGCRMTLFFDHVSSFWYRQRDA